MFKINDPFSGAWPLNGQQLELNYNDLKKYNLAHSGYIIYHEA